MGKICARKETGKLYFDFSFKGQRCREQTLLPDNPANRKKLSKVLQQIEAEVTLGTFEYAKYFPQSPMVQKFRSLINYGHISRAPKFVDFADLWMQEMKIQWRTSHYDTNRGILDQYLIPAFGQRDMSQITKSEIIAFRTKIGGLKGRRNRALSACLQEQPYHESFTDDPE